MLQQRTAILASLLIGVSLHVSVWQVSGAKEPWDDPMYWQVGIPIAILAAACIGYLAKGSAWMSVILIIPAQIATMMVKSGEPGNLWPLSFALGFVMGLPFLLVAWITARLRPLQRR